MIGIFFGIFFAFTSFTSFLIFFDSSLPDTLVRDVIIILSSFSLNAASSLLIATTARKRVIGTKSLNIIEAISKSFQHVINGGKVGFLFGPEQSGLSNDDVVQADYTISIPLNKNFSSLNLSQAVLLICWEWNKLKISELSPQDNEVLVNKKIKKSTELSNVGDREYFYKQLDEMLTKSGFFYSPEMAPVVKRNIRSLFNRASLTHQDLRTLHGIIRSLSEKGNRA